MDARAPRDVNRSDCSCSVQPGLPQCWILASIMTQSHCYRYAITGQSGSIQKKWNSDSDEFSFWMLLGLCSLFGVKQAKLWRNRTQRNIEKPLQQLSATVTFHVCQSRGNLQICSSQTTIHHHPNRSRRKRDSTSRRKKIKSVAKLLFRGMSIDSCSFD